MDSMQRFLTKLRELLRLRVKDADLSEEDFNEAVRQARSHVGGMVRWEKTRAEREAAAAREGHVMNTFRLLGEVVLSEDKTTGQVQIFPAVGKYSHPRYGELAIDKQFLDRVKANFDAKVYQQELPLTIDLEHQSTLSGAAGWITGVEIKGETGMWADIAFNDRGKELVGADAYRYFSPEFYDQWQDPASNKKYQDVLIGGALTNRPFFKGMAPVVMASEGVFVLAEMAMPTDDEMMQKKKMPKDMPEDDEQMMGETKTEDGVDYPKSAYLYTPDDVPSHWKVRIHDSTHKVTRAQLGAAAAALGPGFRGKKAQMPAEARAKAITRLRGLYASLGVKPDEMPAQVRASLAEAGVTETEMLDEVCVALMEAGNTSTGGDNVGMSEEEARQFTEMRESVKTLNERLAAAEAKAGTEEEARKAAETEAKAATERVTALERDANRKQLTEFVRANRMAFQGEVPECVEKLEKLQSKLGDDFADYLDEKHGLHERIKASEIFTESGRPVIAASGAAAEFNAATKAAMAKDPALTESDAVAKVASEQPGLYYRYDREFKASIRRGGE